MVTKFNHSAVSITLNIAYLAWSSSPCEVFHDVLHISCTIAFSLDHVKSLLKSNSFYELRNAESVICDRFKKKLPGLLKQNCTNLSQ